MTDPYTKAEQLEASNWELERENRRLRNRDFGHFALEVILALALVLFGSAIVFGQAQFRRGPDEHAAMQIALKHLRAQEFPPAWKYWWLPQTSSRRVGGARFVLNATINRTDRGVTFPALDDGRILAINLLECSNNFEEFVELLGLFELYADRDFFHNERNQLVEALVISGGSQLEASGKPVCSLPAGFVVASPQESKGWIPCKLVGKSGFVHRSKLRVVKIAPFAAHVQTEMEEFQSLTGSRATFLRADDAVRLGYSTTDEGIYYDLLGIDKLDLAGVMKRAGAKETDLNAFESFNWGAVSTSLVTGQERAYLLAPSLGVAPERSRGVLGLTFDFRNDNRADDPLGTLFLFLQDRKFDAGEGIFILPNGFPYGILYDGQGKLQNVAPQEIATDPNDRTINHQLQAGISCHNCHNYWWKDAGNNVRWLLNNGRTRGGIYGINDPRFNGLTQEQIFGKLASSYRASINGTLDESRKIMASQIAGACGVSAREAIEGATELYALAAYGDYRIADDNWICSPRKVFETHGIEVVGDPTPLEYRAAFAKFFPEPDITTGVIEFPEVAGWRNWTTPEEAIDALQPRMEHLRRSHTYLAAIKDLSSLEVVP